MNYQKFQAISYRLNIVAVSYPEMASLYTEIQNPKFTKCIFDSSDQFATATKYLYGMDFVYLKLNLLTTNNVIVLSQYFDKSLVDSGYVDSGIVNAWRKRVEYFAEMKVRKIQESDLVVLTIDHLSTGFSIWLCSLSLAIFSFIGELCTFWLPKIFSRVRNRVKSRRITQQI